MRTSSSRIHGASVGVHHQSAEDAAHAHSLSDVHIAAIVAQRQHEEFERARAEARSRETGSQTARQSRWAYVPLVDLFAEHNVVHPRSNGEVECGHEPLHSSSSGRCVSINPAKGVWYCRSCRRGGTAVTFVQDLNDWTCAQAAAWLVDRYGPPPGPPTLSRLESRDGVTRWRLA